MEWNWKLSKKTQEITWREEKGVPYLYFPMLETTGLVKNGFSTKLGGVSQGKFATMNFTRTTGDNPDHVMENFKRMAKALGVDMERMVLSYQTHTTNIRRVGGEDVGKGVIRERDYIDVDGLITNVPGITLVTFYADCVPLYFLDPVHKAIGLGHSGWRGTVNRMGRCMLEAMEREFGTKAEDVLACIGPSICFSCFEVGQEVAEEFRKAFAEEWWPEIIARKEQSGKYQVDLWQANRIVLGEAGVLPEHIAVTDICTMCNPQYLFSHRLMGLERGNLSAFLCLNE